MFSRITEQIRRLFGAAPISYELSGEGIIQRSGSAAHELVRLADISSWGDAPHDSRLVLIRLRGGERTIVVGDHRRALRRLLEQVGAEKRVTA